MSFESLTPSQKQVLNLIRVNGELSGADIARLTGLQPSTIVYIVKTLTSLEYIEVSKTGISTSKGGKRPTLLKINANTGFIVGIEVLLHSFRVSVINFAGDPVYQNNIETKQPIDNNNIIPEIIKLVSTLKQNKELKKKNILGVGIALPGLVSSNKGAVLYSTKLNLHNFLLKDSLEAQLKLPIFIGNDANAGVLGVKWFPDKQDAKASNIIYLMYNQDAPNIGSGIVVNNQIYEGISGTAGEITLNLPILSELIVETNKKFLDKKQVAPSDAIPSNLQLKELIELATERNSLIAETILENLCQSISKIVSFLVGFMNPSQIVIGGDLAEFKIMIDRYIFKQVTQQMPDYISHGFVMPEIKISRFGAFSVSMGATAIVLRELYGIN